MLVDTPVVIIGGFGLGNFGDDLLMLAAVNAARKVHDAKDITVLIYRGGERYCRRLDAMPQYVVRQAEMVSILPSSPNISQNTPYATHMPC